MQLSLAQLLLAVQLGFLVAVARRAGSQGEGQGTIGPLYAYVAWLALYGIVTSLLGAQGVYLRDGLMPLLPGLWLQVITVLACVVPVLLVPALRDTLRRMVDVTPWHWFAYLQALRVSALGTAYKTAIGEFPLYFELLVGVPDLLFGLSALWVAVKARRGEMSARGFMIWNLIGALVIVPAAPVLLQLGLPGPLQVFTGVPDARAVFTYPMSIAPMIVVPLFVLINLWVAWRLWERQRGAPELA